MIYCSEGAQQLRASSDIFIYCPKWLGDNLGAQQLRASSDIFIYCPKWLGDNLGAQQFRSSAIAELLNYLPTTSDNK